MGNDDFNVNYMFKKKPRKIYLNHWETKEVCKTINPKMEMANHVCNLNSGEKTKKSTARTKTQNRKFGNEKSKDFGEKLRQNNRAIRKMESNERGTDEAWRATESDEGLRRSAG